MHTSTRRRLAQVNVDAPISPFLTPRVPLLTSTPRRSSIRKKKEFVRPVCDVCETCGKEYRCHRSYLNHIRGHKIIDQSSRYPQVDAIKRHLSVNFGKVLDILKEKPAFSKLGREYKEFLTNLITALPSLVGIKEWQEFEDAIHKEMTRGMQSSRFLLPTALISDLQKRAESFLSNVEERKKISDLFQVCLPCDEAMFQFLLSDYVLYLVTDIVKFLCSCMKPQPSVTPAESDTEKNNETAVATKIEYLETIHYIAGSKARAFYKKALQNPTVPAWKNIKQVISERLLESEIVPGPANNVKGWTIAQNRGRLFFVSGALFDFFCGVAQVLENQTSKFRVSCGDAIEKVCEGTVVLLWDEAVGDSLSETESFNLMCGMIRAFSQTFAVGKAKRTINKFRKRPEASVALRSRLAK